VTVAIMIDFCLVSKERAPEWICKELSENEPDKFYAFFGNDELQISTITALSSTGVSWKRVLMPFMGIYPDRDNYEAQQTQNLTQKVVHSVPLGMPSCVVRLMLKTLHPQV
jgi:hypothetical protein